MKPWTLLYVLIALLALNGCAALVDLSEFSAADFRQAATEGAAARAAGGLAESDRWPECFGKIAAHIDALTAATDAPDITVGAAVLAMRAHIGKNRVARPVDADCAQVVLELEHEAIKFSATFFPGGSVATKALPALLRARDFLAR